MGGAKARARKNKKLKEQRKKEQLENLKHKLPFVSVCTPTYNRRPFIPYIIKIFNQQTYPLERMEWIVVDDGTDPVEDLFKSVPQVNYIRVNDKITLGKKRNMMHDYAKGEIIVYMDDDDYYPPERVQHAVETLQANPKAMASGSSKIYIYFKHNKTMYTFGPYGPNHATAGTFAFRRELTETSRYNDDAAIAEEKEFLKNYTVPFVQLDPRKTILVFSHEHNTFDKRRLLETPNPKIIQKSPLKVKDFVKDTEVRQFFMEDIEPLLKEYEPGRPEMKPDVLKQIKEIDEKRKKDMEERSKQYGQGNQIVIKNKDGQERALKINEVAELLKRQQSEIGNARNEIEHLKQKVHHLETELSNYTSFSQQDTQKDENLIDLFTPNQDHQLILH